MGNDRAGYGLATTRAGSAPRPRPPEPWRDPDRPVPERVADLLGRMTLAEKVAQLYGVWVGPAVDRGPDGDGQPGQDGSHDVAPFQHELVDGELDWPELIRAGLGQLTRPFGTAPVEPAAGAGALAMAQAEIVAAGRFGIPAVVHEECLYGLMIWGATIYPVPLAWGATFDPELVERMAGQIGQTMRGLGIHQGLAPVLDVLRDARWGRCEETIGEDPYLVGTVGTSYVRGLQAAGVVATLKHLVGYSGSRGGRNFGPVAAGRRELADVLLPPFLLAVRDGGARSVMSAYTEVDGMPAAADRQLFTGLLRDTWGFAGTVVSDYFGVTFVQTLHRLAGGRAEAAALTLAAGVDVELPAVRCYGEPLLGAVRDGTVPASLVDRAAARVLTQKCELGLLDPGWQPGCPAGPAADPADGVRGKVDIDPPGARALARQVAEESVVLVANDGVLPLRPGGRIALVGPQADQPAAMLGGYSFPRHVGVDHPELPLGVPVPTLLAALTDELPDARIEHVAGCAVDGGDRSGIPLAVAAAEQADVCVVAVGDHSGLFGRGTSGEGCDAADLRLPGAQQELVSALLATGTPVVLVLLAGRPYALGDPDSSAVSGSAAQPAAVVQAFFPGEEGGPAVAGVLAGRVCPSGRLPVSVPRDPGGQPPSYLAPPLGRRNDGSSVDPTPRYPFGHGLSYTTFDWHDVEVDGGPVAADGVLEVGTDGEVSVSVAVTNTGDRAGADVVQLYLHDPVAQVTRPVVRLTGYARVPLEPGQTRRVRFQVHADLSAFTGRDGHCVVEPGDLELRLSASSELVRHVVRLRLVGPERAVDHRRRLTAGVTVR